MGLGEDALAYGTLVISWLTLFGLAFLVDLLAGSPALLGRLMGPDDLIGRAARILETRLNRPQRAARGLTVRGIILLLLLLPALFGIGLVLNRMAAAGSTGFAVAAVLLALTVRQRRGWDRVLKAARASATAGKAQSEAGFAAARTGAEKLVLTFAETVVAGLILFTLGGFALLLPFQFLATLMTIEAHAGARGTKGPFFAAARLFYIVLSLPAAVLAALVLAVTPLFLPGTRPMAVRGLLTAPKGRLPLRLWPLAVTAEALGLAFETGSKKTRADARWIGPRDGRARLNAADILRTGRMVLVAEAVILLLIIMLMSLILAGA